MANVTPISGATWETTYASQPEGGAEYGIDLGGHVGQSVYSPVNGTVIGYQPGSSTTQSWGPGRLLIRAQNGMIIGIGHIQTIVKTGQQVSIGDPVGSMQVSPDVGPSNAHIELMAALPGSNPGSGYYNGSAFRQTSVSTLNSLGSLALGHGGQGPTYNQDLLSASGLHYQTLGIIGNMDQFKSTLDHPFGPLSGFFTWVTQKALLTRVLFVGTGAVLIIMGLKFMGHPGPANVIVDMGRKAKQGAEAVAASE